MASPASYYSVIRGTIHQGAPSDPVPLIPSCGAHSHVQKARLEERCNRTSMPLAARLALAIMVAPHMQPVTPLKALLVSTEMMSIAFNVSLTR